jgi:2-polyprenyl-6-hydroxyphenyl methylase/3-demethylubiquinone-9 3-methyltransferase
MTSLPPRPARSSTLDPAEQARFSRLEGDWWQAESALQGLRAYNPVRLTFIRQAAQQGLGLKDANPLKGLSILDIGCGGGLLAEPLARAGAKVTGLDATPASIAAARRHAKACGLAIDYRVSTIERFSSPQPFDMVIASEVLEHVADADAFLRQAARLVRPGGVMVVTTLNRTLRSLALGVIAAEHMLNLAPIGTHTWHKFRKPSEVAAALTAEGLVMGGLSGARYNPLTGAMTAAPHDLTINYLLWAQRPPKPQSAKRARK